MNKKIALLFALVMTGPMVCVADTQQALNQDQTNERITELKDEARFHQMVDSASEVYESIVKGAHGQVPATTLNHARCIATLPNVLTGAIIVGGAHGQGLASCKDDSGRWSQPVSVSLNQGSIGLQAGAKSTDLVLFFQTKEAVRALKSGKFNLGADVSAVAGKYDSKVDTANAGVVVFSRTEGAFAGVSVNGSVVGRDQDELASYYGKKVDYTEILEGRENPDSAGYTERFTKLLPR